MHPCKSFKLFLASLTAFEVRSIRRARQQSKEILLERYLRAKGIKDLQTFKNVNFHLLTQELERMQSPLKHSKMSYKAFLRRRSSMDSVTRADKDNFQISSDTDNHTGKQTTRQDAQNQMLLGSQSTSQLDQPNTNWYDPKDGQSILSPHTPLRKSFANYNNTLSSLQESQEIQSKAIKSVENYRKSIKNSTILNQGGLENLVRQNTKQAEKPRSSFFAVKETNQGLAVTMIPEETKNQTQKAKVQEIFYQLQGQDTRKSAIEATPHSDQRWINNLFDYHKYEQTSPSRKNLESSPTTGTDLSSEQFGTTKACEQVYLPEQTQFLKSDTFNKSGNLQQEISAIDEVRAFELNQIYKRKSTIAHYNENATAEPINSESQFRTKAITSTYSKSRVSSPDKFVIIQQPNQISLQNPNCQSQLEQKRKSHAFIPQGGINCELTQLGHTSPYKQNGYDNWNVFMPQQIFQDNNTKSPFQINSQNQSMSVGVSPKQQKNFEQANQQILNDLPWQSIHEVQQQAQFRPYQFSNNQSREITPEKMYGFNNLDEQTQAQLICDLKRISLIDQQRQSLPLLNYGTGNLNLGLYSNNQSPHNSNDVSAVKEVRKSLVQSYIPHTASNSQTVNRDLSPQLRVYNPPIFELFQQTNQIQNPKRNSILVPQRNSLAQNVPEGGSQAKQNCIEQQNLPRQSILDASKQYLAQFTQYEIDSMNHPQRQISPDKTLRIDQSNSLQKQSAMDNYIRKSLIDQQRNSLFANLPVDECISPVYLNQQMQPSFADSKMLQKTLVEEERRKSFINSVPIAFLTEKIPQSRKSSPNIRSKNDTAKKDLQKYKNSKRKSVTNIKRKYQAKPLLKSASPVPQTILVDSSHSQKQNLSRNSVIEDIRKSLLQSVPSNLIYPSQQIEENTSERNFDDVNSKDSDAHQNIQKIQRKSTIDSQIHSFGTPIMQQTIPEKQGTINNMSQISGLPLQRKSTFPEQLSSQAQPQSCGALENTSQSALRSPEKLIGYDNMNLYIPKQQTLEYLRQQSTIDQQQKSLDYLMQGGVANAFTRSHKTSPANIIGKETAQQNFELDSRRQSVMQEQNQVQNLVKSSTFTDPKALLRKSTTENQQSYDKQEKPPVQNQSSIKEFRKSQAQFTPNEITNTYSKTRQVSPIKMVSFDQPNLLLEQQLRQSVVKSNQDLSSSNLPDSKSPTKRKNKSDANSQNDSLKRISLVHQANDNFLTLGKCDKNSPKQSDDRSSNSKTNSNQFSPEHIVEFKQKSPALKEQNNRRKTALRSHQQSPLIVTPEPKLYPSNNAIKNSQFKTDLNIFEQPQIGFEIAQNQIQQPISFRQQNYSQNQEQQLHHIPFNCAAKETELSEIFINASNSQYQPPILPRFEKSNSLIGSQALKNPLDQNVNFLNQNFAPPGILRSSSLIISQSSPINQVTTPSNLPITNEPKFSLALHNTLGANSPDHNTSIAKSGFSSPATQYYTPFTGQDLTKNFYPRDQSIKIEQFQVDRTDIPNQTQGFCPDPHSQGIHAKTNKTNIGGQPIRNPFKQVQSLNETTKQVGSSIPTTAATPSTFNLKINVEIDNNGIKQSWTGGNFVKNHDKDLEQQLKRKILSNPEEPLDRELIRKLYFQMFCSV